MKEEWAKDEENLESWTLELTIQIKVHDSHRKSRESIANDIRKIIVRDINASRAWRYTADVLIKRDLLTENGDCPYKHSEMNYDLTRPNVHGYGWIAEAWSPIHPDYPYDSDGWEDTYQGIRFYANQWMHRFPDYYAIIIRGPKGGEVYRELTRDKRWDEE